MSVQKNQVIRPDGKSEIAALSATIHEKIKSEKGTYLAWFFLPQTTYFPSVGRTGRFQNVRLQTGYYVYVGSAFCSGGVRARVALHARHPASGPWQIHYVRTKMQMVEAWVTYDEVKRECRWARVIPRLLEAKVPVFGFGSTDCHKVSKACMAHFYSFPAMPSFRRFVNGVKRMIPGHAPVERITLSVPPANAKQR